MGKWGCLDVFYGLMRVGEDGFKSILGRGDWVDMFYGCLERKGGWGEVYFWWMGLAEGEWE